MIEAVYLTFIGQLNELIDCAKQGDMDATVRLERLEMGLQQILGVFDARNIESAVDIFLDEVNKG